MLKCFGLSGWLSTDPEKHPDIHRSMNATLRPNLMEHVGPHFSVSLSPPPRDPGSECHQSACGGTRNCLLHTWVVPPLLLFSVTAAIGDLRLRLYPERPLGRRRREPGDTRTPTHSPGISPPELTISQSDKMLLIVPRADNLTAAVTFFWCLVET